MNNIEELKINIKQLRPDAILPQYSHDYEDACFDLTAVGVKVDEHGNNVYYFGWAFEIPQGYVGLVFPRSSIAKKDMILSNAVGVIDPGYRGEVMAKFKPQSILPASQHASTQFYTVGERVCQMMLVKIPHLTLNVVEELSDSTRGKGGYGSTGK